MSRSIYRLPNNIDVWQDGTYPFNIFKKPYFGTVLDVVLKMTPENIENLKKMGGTIDENWYTLKGYGHPRFDKGSSEEQLKLAWEFINKLNKGEFKNEDEPCIKIKSDGTKQKV